MAEEQFGKLDQALQDLRDGKLILVIDDPERENEGDLICAAEHATPENVNIMASLAKGLICMPMSSKICEQLGLPQMVDVNTDNHATAFTVSIDHIDTTTGISAFERSLTAVKAVEDGVRPEHFRRPGHMFPLEARQGGSAETCGAHGGDGGSYENGGIERMRTVLRDHAGGRHDDADDGIACLCQTARVYSYYR